MSHPESVYELLALLLSHGGRMPVAEIPEHLRNALAICQGNLRWVHVAHGDMRSPLQAFLTMEGRAELARHIETADAGSGEQPADAGGQQENPAEPVAMLTSWRDITAALGFRIFFCPMGQSGLIGMKSNR